MFNCNFCEDFAGEASKWALWSFKIFFLFFAANKKTPDSRGLSLSRITLQSQAVCRYLPELTFSSWTSCADRSIAKAVRAQLLQPSPGRDAEGFMFLEVWVSRSTLLTISKAGWAVAKCTCAFMCTATVCSAAVTETFRWKILEGDPE